MTLSLSEVEALSRKAARGAGLAWGHAEDAGKAVRWLAQHGFDGPRALAGTLDIFDGVAHEARGPRATGNLWVATGPYLCPITAGAVLSDHAAQLRDGMALEGVVHPVLLLPFLVWSSAQSARHIAVKWADAEVSFFPTSHVFVHDGRGLGASEARRAEIAVIDAFEAPPPSLQSRARVDAKTLTLLENFAHRTYAPDTAESRLSGAGAGLTDND